MIGKTFDWKNNVLIGKTRNYVYLRIGQSDSKNNLKGKKDFERKKNVLIRDYFFDWNYVYLRIAQSDSKNNLKGKKVF